MEFRKRGLTVTMRELLEAGVHFGHQTRFWSPKMAPYIFGARNRIHILNLEKTLAKYNEAMAFVKKLTSNRGTILFVGTKRQSREIIAEEAQRAGAPYVDQHWLGGMLNNFKSVKAAIKRLKDIELAVESGDLERMPKKEAHTLRRELEKLQKSIGGLKDMAGLPDALFVVDVGYHKIAVAEAEKLGIPVIGVVDTNHSPDGVSYVIPGNDDSSRAIQLYARGVADAILEGRSQLIESRLECEVIQDVREYALEVAQGGGSQLQLLRRTLKTPGSDGDFAPSPLQGHVSARISVVDIADSSLEPDVNVELAKALARGNELQEHLFYSDEMLTEQEFSEKRAALFDELMNANAGYAVLRLPHPSRPGLFAYPSWQLEPTVAKVLPDILKILTNLSPWAMWHFFHTSHPVLLELSPLEAWGIPSAEGRGRSYSDRKSSLRDEEKSVGDAIKRAASAYMEGQD